MKLVIALLCAGALAVAGCSSDNDSNGDATTTTEASAGSARGSVPTSGDTYDVDGNMTIDATVGETFTINLAANETTGYRWSEKIEGDAVRSDGGTYEAPKSGAAGAGGTQVYNYTAEQAGTSTITLTYAQVGSGDVGETLVVTVDVT